MSSRRLQLSSKARDMLVLVLVNVIVRTTWLLYAHPAQRADFQWYFVRATELARGQGYTANGVPTAYWPMGWPFFLSLVFRVTGSSVVVGLMVNAALSIGIVLLVYVAALKLWASRRICVAAALAYTLLPSQVEWNSILGSEELFTCLALASLVVYGMKGRPTWAHRVTSGVLMGLACDVRPVGLLFFIVVFAYERWVNRTGTMTSAARTFVYTIAMIAAIAPMTLRNWIVFHHFILVSTNGGVNLWQGTHANGDYYWSYDPAVNPLLAAGTNEIAENAIGIRAAVAIYIHYPWSMLGNAMIKLWCLYRNDVNAAFYVYMANPSGSETGWLGWFDSIVYWVWMAVSVCGMVCSLMRRQGRAATLFVGFVVYNSLVFLFFPAWDRFRYPMMPVFALYTGYGIVRWRGLVQPVARMLAWFRPV